MSGDTLEKRQLAVKQRDEGLLTPGDADYDAKMREVWGGPPIQWHTKAMQAWPSKYNAEGKVALVTGSTGGIGFYIAKLLAACGCTVIVPARPGLEFEAQDTVKAISAELPAAKLVVPEVPLDLRSFQSVRNFAADVRKLQPRLDILCLNAGRGGGAQDPREVTSDGFEAIFQVNTSSQFLLTAELMPLLQASPEARVVAQSSGARFNGKTTQLSDLDATDITKWNGWSQYSLSKACMCLLALGLNERLQAAGISNIIALASEPGLTATGVNIQHDLVRSLGLTQRGLQSTNQMHDQAAHHAADGALPMVLASLTGARNDFFESSGRSSQSLADAAFAIQPRRGDPMLWPKPAVDSFWDGTMRLTGAQWPF